MLLTPDEPIFLMLNTLQYYAYYTLDNIAIYLLAIFKTGMYNKMVKKCYTCSNSNRPILGQKKRMRKQSGLSTNV